MPLCGYVALDCSPIGLCTVVIVSSPLLGGETRPGFLIGYNPAVHRHSLAVGGALAHARSAGGQVHPARVCILSCAAPDSPPAAHSVAAVGLDGAAESGSFCRSV